MRKILLHAAMEYSLWLTNPRMSILPVLLALIHSMVIRPLAEVSEQIGAPLHLLEPVVALCSSTVILLILPIGFFILMADFPRMDRGFLLRIYRVGRLNWVLGELLYLCMAAATYLAGVLIGTMVCSLPYAPVIGSGWSPVVTEDTAILAADMQKTVATLLPGNLSHQMGPVTAVVESAFLLLLCFTLMGAVLLAAGLLKVKFLGVAANAGFLLVGAGFVILDSAWMWAFPTAHALTWIHFTPYLRKPVCPLWVSRLYFVLAAALLLVLAILIARKRSFDSILEFD